MFLVLRWSNIRNVQSCRGSIAYINSLSLQHMLLLLRNSSQKWPRMCLRIFFFPISATSVSVCVGHVAFPCAPAWIRSVLALSEVWRLLKWKPWIMNLGVCVCVCVSLVVFCFIHASLLNSSAKPRPAWLWRWRFSTLSQPAGSQTWVSCRRLGEFSASPWSEATVYLFHSVIVICYVVEAGTVLGSYWLHVIWIALSDSKY